MNKLYISKKMRSKDKGPPSQTLGTLIIQEDTAFPKDERELLSYIFIAYGSGKYTLQIEDDEGMFRTAWKGALAKKKTERGTIIPFKALDQNSLEYHLDVEELTVPGRKTKRKFLGDPKKKMPKKYLKKASKERKKRKGN
jgi:hypothetical protein